MTRVLAQIIAQAALFLEFADDATLDPDSAVKQLEDMAFQLQQLPQADRSELVRMLNEIAREWPSEQEREYLLALRMPSASRERA
jgi:hypothetical protein